MIICIGKRKKKAADEAFINCARNEFTSAAGLGPLANRGAGGGQNAEPDLDAPAPARAAHQLLVLLTRLTN